MRIAVVGTSGSGKTTLAARVAAALGVSHIDLDAVTWQPGWVALHEADPDEFLRRAAALMAGDAWVSCGNYITSRPPLLARATHLVWLDYSRPRIMVQVIRRSFVRALAKDELWPGTGNREEFRNWIDKGHPIRWAWDTYERRRAQYEKMFEDPALERLERIRLRHPREAEALIARLARDASNSSSSHGQPPESGRRPARGQAPADPWGPS
jgi:adenylate kinase family enzyme